MTTDEYVPDEQDFIDSWACAHVTPHDMTAAEAKDVARAFLARVRRDAAREFVDRTLLDWGIGEDEDSNLGPATADDLRAAVDDVYPEEAP